MSFVFIVVLQVDLLEPARLKARPMASSSSFVQDHLDPHVTKDQARGGYVFAELPLHELAIIGRGHRQQQLVVEKEAALVEVGAPERRPTSVDRDAFCAKHAAQVLVDAHAGRQERRIERVRRPCDRENGMSTCSSSGSQRGHFASVKDISTRLDSVQDFVQGRPPLVVVRRSVETAIVRAIPYLFCTSAHQARLDRPRGSARPWRRRNLRVRTDLDGLYARCRTDRNAWGEHSERQVSAARARNLRESSCCVKQVLERLHG